MHERLRILVLGVTGMLGHTLLHELGGDSWEIYGTTRSGDDLGKWFAPETVARIHTNIEAENFDAQTKCLAAVRPHVVINAIGIIKQLPAANDPVSTIGINAMFPHRLANLCSLAGARLIHISTDCVFDGKKGNYVESDLPTPEDLYGRSKLLGEVNQYPHCLTLRTSIIGHELKSKLGLVEWFLSQRGKVRGFTHAIYSGFPTVELARIIRDYVLVRPDMNGLYHVSSAPINKYDLLRLVADRYNKSIDIEPYATFCCDRSLDSSNFRNATGYVPRSWEEMIDHMYQDAVKRHLYKEDF